MKKQSKLAAGLRKGGIATTTPARTAAGTSSPRTRPKGRSADPVNFRQATVYLAAKTLLAAKMRALAESRDLSQVVDNLLDAWLSGKISV